MQSTITRTARSRRGAIRAFIHSSANLCSKGTLNAAWNWLDPLSLGNNTGSAALPAGAIHGNDQYVRKRVFDRRKGKSVDIVYARPTFELGLHPSAAHPCVKGLTLDHGQFTPVDEPIVVHRLVRYARTQQLEAAACEEDVPRAAGTKGESSQTWHWNIPKARRAAWRQYWTSRPKMETTPAAADTNKEYTITTFVGLDQSSVTPDYERGPTSVVFTCLLPEDVAVDVDSADALSWLGPPKHIVELIFALDPKAIGPLEKPVMPTVSRISPARYVLTFKDQKARDRFLLYWRRYSTRIEGETGRTPPFVLTADITSKAGSTEPSLPGPLGVRRGTARGDIWVGKDRFTAIDKLSGLVPPVARQLRASSSTRQHRSRTELISGASTSSEGIKSEPSLPDSPVLASLEQQRRFLLFDPPAERPPKTPIILPPRQGRLHMIPKGRNSK